MISMATLAAKAAAELGHAHPLPRPAKPWWTWACLQCRPALYRAVVRADRDDEDKKTKCPWCHESAQVADGVLAYHQSCSQVCLASGLSRRTACALLEAAANGKTVADALRWAAFSAPEDVSLPKGPLNPVLAAIRQHMRETGQRGVDVAAATGITKGALFRWWSDRGFTPKLDSLLKVVEHVGMEMVYRHPVGSVMIDGQEALHEHSALIRQRTGITVNLIAERLGISQSVVLRREKNLNRIGLQTAMDWAEATGGRLTVRVRREPED